MIHGSGNPALIKILISRAQGGKALTTSIERGKFDFKAGQKLCPAPESKKEKLRNSDVGREVEEELKGG